MILGRPVTTDGRPFPEHLRKLYTRSATKKTCDDIDKMDINDIYFKDVGLLSY